MNVISIRSVGLQTHWSPRRADDTAVRDAAAGQDDAFIELLQLYRAHGGLAREIELLARLKRRGATGEAAIRPERFASSIRFPWGGWQWLPLFQFCTDDLSLHPHAARVIDELAAVFDGWALAQWFAASNSCLRGRRPIDVIHVLPDLVVEAARVDRFVAAG